MKSLYFALGSIFLLAGAAQADITDSGNEILGGTMTVQGDAFTRGKFDFVVTAGNVGIGTSSPGSTLQVAGAGTFNSGVTATSGTFTQSGSSSYSLSLSSGISFVNGAKINLPANSVIRWALERLSLGPTAQQAPPLRAAAVGAAA